MRADRNGRLQSDSFIVLSSRPGQYRSEATNGLDPVQCVDYRYAGRLLTTFTIVRIPGTAGTQDAADRSGETAGKPGEASPKVRVVEAGTENLISLKFFERFPSVAAAVASLQPLVGPSHAEASLTPRPLEWLNRDAMDTHPLDQM